MREAMIKSIFLSYDVFNSENVIESLFTMSIHNEPAFLV